MPNPYLTMDPNPPMAGMGHHAPAMHPADEFGTAHYHVAFLLGIALFILVAMKTSGFRAMVGIGRS